MSGPSKSSSSRTDTNTLLGITNKKLIKLREDPNISVPSHATPYSLLSRAVRLNDAPYDLDGDEDKREEWVTGRLRTEYRNQYGALEMKNQPVLDLSSHAALKYPLRLPVDFQGRARWALLTRFHPDWNSEPRIQDITQFEALVKLAYPDPLDFTINYNGKFWFLTMEWVKNTLTPNVIPSMTEGEIYTLYKEIRNHLDACSLDWSASDSEASKLYISLDKEMPYGEDRSAVLTGSEFSIIYPPSLTASTIKLKSAFAFYSDADSDSKFKHVYFHPRHRDRFLRMVVYPGKINYLLGQLYPQPPISTEKQKEINRDEQGVLFLHRETFRSELGWFHSGHFLSKDLRRPNQNYDDANPMKDAPVRIYSPLRALADRVHLPTYYIDWLIDGKPFRDPDSGVDAFGPTPRQMARVRNDTRRKMRAVKPKELFEFSEKDEDLELADDINSECHQEYSPAMLENIPW